MFQRVIRIDHLKPVPDYIIFSTRARCGNVHLVRVRINYTALISRFSNNRVSKTRLGNEITENDSNRMKWQIVIGVQEPMNEEKVKREDWIWLHETSDSPPFNGRKIKMRSIRRNCKLPSVIWQTVNVTNTVPCCFFFIQYFPFKLFIFGKNPGTFSSTVCPNSIDNSTIYAASYIVWNSSKIIFSILITVASKCIEMHRNAL